MTKAEVAYIIEDILGESTDVVTPLNSVNYILLDKFEIKYQDIKHMRFKIDLKNGLLVCYHCKPYNGPIKSEWKKYKEYDIYEDNVYLYMVDNNKNPIVDVYTIDSISMIAPKPTDWMSNRTEIDLSNVSLNTNTFVYDGSEKKLQLLNVPADVHYYVYDGSDSETEVGEYSVTYKFIIDDVANYRLSDSRLTFNWNISEPEEE